MLATRGSGLQELDVLWPGNGFDYCYPDGCSRVLLPQWCSVRNIGYSSASQVLVAVSSR